MKPHVKLQSMHNSISCFWLTALKILNQYQIYTSAVCPQSLSTIHNRQYGRLPLPACTHLLTYNYMSSDLDRSKYM